MNFQDIKRLVAQGEGLHIEFKRKAADPIKIMREVVAFANNGGGKLLVGVDDDGSIPGLKYADEEAFVLVEAIEKHCLPAIQYKLEKVPMNEKRSVLVFHIAEAARKPVYLLYNLKKKSGRAYFRLADRSIQTSREMRRVLKARSLATDVHISYGPAEQAVMRCFQKAERMSLADFIVMSQIPPAEASEVLVKLTLANVLELHPGELQDFYTMKDPDSMLP